MRFLSILRAMAWHSVRDKINIFFNLFFPLITLLIFGYVFSGIYSQSSVNIGFYGQKLPPISGVKYIEYPSISELINAVSSQKINLGITLNGTALLAYINPVNLQSSNYYTSIVKSVADEINRSRGINSVIKVERNEISFSGKHIDYLDNLIPGILALSIFSAGIFSITASLAHFRDKKVIKKFWITPLAKWEFYAAFISEKMVESLLSIILLFVAAVVFFKPPYSIDFVRFTLTVLAGTFGMMGIGMIILLISPSARVASEVSSVLYTVIMFFSGVYFPLDLLPKFLQYIAYGLPLTYLVMAMKSAMGIAPMSNLSYYLTIAIMFFGSVLVLLGFSRIFKVE
ncbi:ABC transporter permease [Athalassotoga sp.]|uniref:ABC transporter permease n=1 Tax=Athalassotoga sp. TaxID=2022597 RepID=UPI003CFD4716